MLLRKLIRVANKLDSLKYFKEADEVDSVLRKMASNPPPIPTDLVHNWGVIAARNAISFFTQGGSPTLLSRFLKIKRFDEKEVPVFAYIEIIDEEMEKEYGELTDSGPESASELGISEKVGDIELLFIKIIIVGNDLYDPAQEQKPDPNFIYKFISEKIAHELTHVMDPLAFPWPPEPEPSSKRDKLYTLKNDPEFDFYWAAREEVAAYISQTIKEIENEINSKYDFINLSFNDILKKSYTFPTIMAGLEVNEGDDKKVVPGGTLASKKREAKNKYLSSLYSWYLKTKELVERQARPDMTSFASQLENEDGTEEDWDIEREEKMLSPQRIEEEEKSWKSLEEEKRRRSVDKYRRMTPQFSGWEPTEGNEQIDYHINWLEKGVIVSEILVGKSEETNKLQEEINKMLLKSDYDSKSLKDLEEKMYRITSLSFLENIKNFVKNNLVVLNKIVKNYGGQAPDYLDYGAHGDVWLLGSGHILKISLQSPQYVYKKEMTMLYEKIPGAEFQNMIHAYGKFKGKFPLHWVVMEKFVSVDELEEKMEYDTHYDLEKIIKLSEKNIKKLFGEEGSYGDQWIEDYIKGFRFSPENWWFDYFIKNFNESVQNNVEKLSNDIKDKIKLEMGAESIKEIESSISNLAPDWIENLAKQQIINYMSGHRDLHAGNLGLREAGRYKYFVYFDA